MGDPTKSDIIKPDNKFDEDDIHTINQLKEALKPNSRIYFQIYRQA